MPLTGSHVIPQGWEAHHTPVTDDAMTAVCHVTRRTSAASGFDQQTGRSIYPDPTIIYAGRCRVTTTVQQQSATDVGGSETTEAGYELAVPLTAPLFDVNDVAEIMQATDPLMVGRLLQVVEAHGGSLVWQRTYQCEAWSATAR